MLKVKVCGIRDQINLDYLEGSNVDYIGFIFYDQSKRFFEEGNVDTLSVKSCSKKKVGVFVDATRAYIESMVGKYGLDVIQLHGDESPAFCKSLKSLNCTLFKAIAIGNELPDDLKAYSAFIDAFLFDTKGKYHGGNGQKFNWRVLSEYTIDTPFILSGGIDETDVDDILKFANDQLIGVDINSKFEIQPGLKDQNKIEIFIKKLKHEYVGNEN